MITLSIINYIFVNQKLNIALKILIINLMSHQIFLRKIISMTRYTIAAAMIETKAILNRLAILFPAAEDITGEKLLRGCTSFTSVTLSSISPKKIKTKNTVEINNKNTNSITCV